MRKEIKIYKNFDGIWEFFGGCGFAVIFTIPAVVCLSFKIFWGILFLVLIFRIYIFSVVDFIFNKTIILDEDKFYIKIGGVRFELNKNRTYLKIDKVEVPSSSFGGVSKGIILVRNNKKMINRLFKNKIKLIAEGKRINLYKYGENLAKELGINFVGEIKF